MRNDYTKEGMKTVNIIFTMFKNRHHLYNVLSKEELEDMRQEGMLEMLLRLKSFEPQRGLALSTYLSPRILGTFKDYIKKEVTREKKRSIISLWIQLDEKKDKDHNADIPLILRLKDLKITKKLTKDIDIDIREIENHNILGALSSLSDREQYIIISYYILNRKTKDIAEEIGYSLAWVSSIKTKGIEKLKKLLTEDLL